MMKVVHFIAWVKRLGRAAILCCATGVVILVVSASTQVQGAVISEVLLERVTLEVNDVGSGGSGGSGGGGGGGGTSTFEIPAYVEIGNGYHGGVAGDFELLVVDARSTPGRVLRAVDLGTLAPAETLVVHEGVWPTGIFGLIGGPGSGARRVALEAGESLELLAVFGGARSLLIFAGSSGLQLGDAISANQLGLGGELVGSLTYRAGIGVPAFPVVVDEGVVEALARDSLRRRFVGGDYVTEAGGVDVGPLFVDQGLLLMENALGQPMEMNPGSANSPTVAVVIVPEASTLACWVVVGVMVFWGRMRRC